MKPKKFSNLCSFVFFFLNILFAGEILAEEIELKTQLGNTDSIVSVAFSPDGTLILTGSDIEPVKLWSISKGRLIRAFEDYGSGVWSVVFTPDGKSALAACNDHRLRLWDISTGRLIRTFEGHLGSVTSVAISQDGKYVLSGDIAGNVGLWDSRTGSPLRLIKPIQEHLPRRSLDKLKEEMRKNPNALDDFKFEDFFPIQSVDLSPNGIHILSGSWGSELVVLRDKLTGKVIREFKGHNGGVKSVCISPNGRYALSGSNDHTMKLWDITTGHIMKTFDGHTNTVNSVTFSPDGKYALSGSDDHTMKLWSISTEQVLHTFIGHSGCVLSVDFAPDGKYALSGNDDHTMKLWNIQKGDYISFAGSKNEWIIFTQDGYFDGSKRCGEFIAIVKEMDLFSVDQFAIVNNRPDIILERMGIANKNLTDYYYSLYKRRIRLLNLKQLERDYSVPEVEIVYTKQDGKFVDINFTLKDSKYNLKTYNIYVNDVPIFGAYGREISGTELNKTERIELTSDKNKIEITCINDIGAESYRAITYANYDRDVRADLYYIGFGVSRYRDHSLNLQYAAKDVDDLAMVFSNMEGEEFGNVYVKTYLNEQVTIDNIEEAKAFLANAKVDDTFVLFIAGHGVHAMDKSATYYYLVYDTNLSRLPETAVSFDLIENLLQGIAPRNKLFLMDTCESGEAEGSFQNEYSLILDNHRINARTSRGIRIMLKASNTVQEDDRSYLFEKDRFIYNDLLRRSGTMVFSSSRGDEFSYESDWLENGFFTEAIIKSFREGDKNGDGIVSTDELRDYVSDIVPKQTGNRQHPTVDRDNIYQKFGFPLVEEVR